MPVWLVWATGNGRYKIQYWLLQGAILLTLKKGEDLPAADPNGYSDPYVKFKLNNKTQKSTIKRFTINPAWNETFEWFKVNAVHS